MASSGPNLDMSMGIILIGLTVTASLFGVTSSQVMWYFRRYPQDRRFLQLLVTTVWGMDAFNLFLYSSAVWDYLVNKNLSSFGGLSIPWTSNAQIVVNTIATTIIQSFYTYRIWSLTRTRALTCFLISTVSANFALGLLLFIKSVTTKSLADYVRLMPFDIANSSATAATDVCLCSTLVALLIRSRTGSAGSDRLINHLLFYTINTGVLTSVFAIASLITVVVLPGVPLYVLFYYIGARMYSVSLLATLNARDSLRLTAERYSQASLPRLSRKSSSISRRSVRAIVDAMTPSKEKNIIVSIHRNTTVTFEERSDEDMCDSHRRGPYRYQPQSPTAAPLSPKLISVLPPAIRNSIGISRPPNLQVASFTSSDSDASFTV